MATIFTVAAVVNYLWEMAQSPLYICSDISFLMWRHSLLASLGDGFLVLLIFAVGYAFTGRRDWFENPGIRGYLIMIVTGLTIATTVELVSVHTFYLWSYNQWMPLIPILEIGITPVVQMIVIPPLIFRLVTSLQREIHPSSFNLP